jgi:hypothetical protein
MQPQPLTSHEVIALLQHKIARAQAEGLSPRQAEAVVALRLGVDPAKLAGLSRQSEVVA